MPVVQRYDTLDAYLLALGKDAARWFTPKRGSYADLKDSGLLPRGL